MNLSMYGEINTQYKIEELMKLRCYLDNLWDSTENKDGPKQRLIVLIMDSIDNLLNETNIKQEHINIIKETMSILGGDITDDTVDYYIEYLIEKDIPVVRFTPNMAMLYE